MWCYYVEALNENQKRIAIQYNPNIRAANGVTELQLDTVWVFSPTDTGAKSIQSLLQVEAKNYPEKNELGSKKLFMQKGGSSSSTVGTVK